MHTRPQWQTTSFIIRNNILSKPIPKKESAAEPSEPMSTELVQEMNTLETKLKQVNYKLLIATRLPSVAFKKLKKIIYTLSSIVSNTKTIQNYLTNSENKNDALYYGYAARLATIISDLKNRIDKSGMFPKQINTIDKSQYITTLKNEPEWIFFFNYGVKNILDKWRAPQSVKNEFLNLIETIDTLQDLTNIAKENVSSDQNNARISFSPTFFSASVDKNTTKTKPDREETAEPEKRRKVGDPT